MGFLTSKADRDFARGIYLQPFGSAPSLDTIEETPWPETLYLPLTVYGHAPMEILVREGQDVSAHTLLARGGTGRYLWAPCAGKVGVTTTACVQGQLHQPVLGLQTQPDHQEAGFIESGAVSVTPEMAEHDKVWQALERAGILLCHNGEPLAALLKKLEKQNITTVVANATPIEPTLNTPLALLRQYFEHVFAGLAILKKWLGASEAIMAYPLNFPIDIDSADRWEVRCVPVSEKYPQGRHTSVLHTLRRQGNLRKKRRHSMTPVVFDIQLLLEVEQCIMAGRPVIYRVVTIAGDGVKKPGHFPAPIGLALPELLSRAEMYEDAQCVADGSSMNGIAVDPSRTVIAPTSHIFTVSRTVPRRQPQSCIRCGWCIDDCPAGIDPARLIHLAENNQYEKARRAGLDRCVECGICSYLCPSGLNIMGNIRMMKQKLSSMI